MSDEIMTAIELSDEELDVVAGGIGFGDFKKLLDRQTTEFRSLDILSQKKTFSNRDGSEAISIFKLSFVETSAENETFIEA